MSILGLLPLGALVGFIGHLTRPVVKREFVQAGHYDGWFAIVSYVLGVLFTFPVFVAFVWVTAPLIKINDGEVDKSSLLAVAIGCFFGAFGGIGAGTVPAHWLLPDRD